MFSPERGVERSHVCSSSLADRLDPARTRVHVGLSRDRVAPGPAGRLTDAHGWIRSRPAAARRAQPFGGRERVAAMLAGIESRAPR